MGSRQGCEDRKLNIHCEGCGRVSDFWVEGGLRDLVHLRCNGCGSRVTVFCGMVELDDGTVASVNAAPELSIPVGSDPEDPWVFFRARMLESQRDVIHMAVRRALVYLKQPYSEVAVGNALEAICADFLAGPDPLVET